MTRRLYLVRHGAAEGAEGRAIGHTDLPLSAAGRRAIERLAATWRGPPPDHLVASPLARAAESARILSLAWSLPVEPEPRLAEMSFGEWDGEIWDDVHARDGARLAAWADRWWHDPTPGGEGFADLEARLGEWLDEWVAGDAGGGTTVAVTHAGPIRALLAGRFGFARGQLWDQPLGTGRVSAIEIAVPGAVPRLLFLDRARFAAS